MISNIVLSNILKIVSAVFGSIAMCIRQHQTCSRSFSSTFIIWFCRFLDSTKPRFDSHKLISLILLHTKIIKISLLFLLFFFFFGFGSRNIINILCIFVSFFIYFFFFLIFLNLLLHFFLHFTSNHIPKNDCPIISSC